MRGAPIVALEVNASCPNLESRRGMFAHSPRRRADVVAAARAAGVPLWVKLSPNTPALVEVAGAALEAGAERARAREHAARPGHRHRGSTPDARRTSAVG